MTQHWYKFQGDPLRRSSPGNESGRKNLRQAHEVRCGVDGLFLTMKLNVIDTDIYQLL